MFSHLQNKRLLFNLSDPEYNYFEGIESPPPPPKKKEEKEKKKKLRAKVTKLVD